MMGLLYSAQQVRFTGLRESSSAIQQVVEHMQSNLLTKPDLPVMAGRLGVSYGWLRRTFQQHTGLSPHQYLLELRLIRARHLLSHNTLPVKQVAREAGFEDEHYFCRLFRRKTGVTPTEWRSRGTRTP